MGTKRVIILADGDWPPKESHGIPGPGDHVIAADGGYAQALVRGIDVDEVVGDLDSVSFELRARLLAGASPEVHAYPAEKDWTDLELAIERASEREPDEIIVLGGLGGRIDHTLANLQLLERGIRMGIPIALVSGDESVRLAAGWLDLDDAAPGDTISLIPQTETAVVSTRGLAFPLDRERLFRSATRGVSNVVGEVPAAVNAHEGQLFVIHTRKAPGGS